MLTQTQTLQLALDVVGVFVFALSGGLVGVRAGLDLFGVLVLAGAAGLGGGVVRDIMLGDTPPVGISDWRLIASTVAAGLATFVLHPSIERISGFVRVLDAAGLAAFAISGTLKATGHGTGPMTAVFIGGLTAVGGGIIRDLLAGEVPEVLRRELYAVPALLGSAMLVTAHHYGWDSLAVIWGCVALVFSIRIVAVVLDLNAPTPLRTGVAR